MTLFGTDGIRGTANQYPMTADLAMKVGMSIGAHFRTATNGHRVLIGKDTRLSGYMLESALTAGLTAMGMNVLLVGPLPTPAISFLTRALRCDAGIMLSASHNKAIDNGIKLFDSHGQKLDQETESRLEHLIENPPALSKPEKIGRATRIEDAYGRYAEHLKSRVPSEVRFDGLRVVLDAANGAGYKVAPAVLWELGAEVISVGVEPNGHNINDQCGSTHPQTTRQKVLETRADIGICLDGDADRVILVDNTGKIIDGDQILALMATQLKAQDTLQGPLVGTEMCNVALEEYLDTIGVDLVRAPVGDKNVALEMKRLNANLGGENSGHIIMGQHGATGDGILAALHVLVALKNSGKDAHSFLNLFDPAPQATKNITIKRGATPHLSSFVQDSIKRQETLMATCGGRVLVRASGTEPLIRVMAEGRDEDKIETAISEILGAIEMEMLGTQSA